MAWDIIVLENSEKRRPRPINVACLAGILSTVLLQWSIRVAQFAEHHPLCIILLDWNAIVVETFSQQDLDVVRSCFECKQMCHEAWGHSLSHASTHTSTPFSILGFVWVIGVAFESLRQEGDCCLFSLGVIQLVFLFVHALMMNVDNDYASRLGKLIQK